MKRVKINIRYNLLVPEYSEIIPSETGEEISVINKNEEIIISTKAQGSIGGIEAIHKGRDLIQVPNHSEINMFHISYDIAQPEFYCKIKALGIFVMDEKGNHRVFSCEEMKAMRNDDSFEFFFKGR